MAYDDTLIVDHIRQTHSTELLTEREKHGRNRSPAPLNRGYFKSRVAIGIAVLPASVRGMDRVDQFVAGCDM